MHETLLALILHRGNKADAWRVEGGSDPIKLLGGLAAKKWGRSRPFWCFFHGDFRLRWFTISHSAKKLLAPQVEELGEDEAEVCSSCPSTGEARTLSDVRNASRPGRAFGSGRPRKEFWRLVPPTYSEASRRENVRKNLRTSTFLGKSRPVSGPRSHSNVQSLS